MQVQVKGGRGPGMASLPVSEKFWEAEDWINQGGNQFWKRRDLKSLGQNSTMSIIMPHQLFSCCRISSGSEL